MNTRYDPQIDVRPQPGGALVHVRGDEWQIAGSGSGGGGKGGGKSAKTPKEDPNTLRSIAYARVLFLLCEGQIQGFKDPTKWLQYIYFDNTPTQNADLSGNFQNFTIDYRIGTQSQSYISGFSDTEAVITVSTKVTATGGPISRTLNDPNANAVVVTLMTPQLQQIDAKTGNIHGNSVSFQIRISQNGGAFVTYVSDSFTGKTSSNYERSYRINLPQPGPWVIQVLRTSPDSTLQASQNDLYFESYISIIEAKLAYPNTALMGVMVQADQFKSFPKVSLLLRGLLISIPSNYDPIARTYSGSWNGTFTYAWSNNPAWVLYDLITNTRYGCGKYISASQVDKWSFYQIGQYCDGLVPDNKGGYEPRFTCNAYITKREDAYNLLNSLASVFRGMLYWASGTIFVTQDAPANPVRLFTEANVIQEVDAQGHVTKPTFTYSGSSAKARHTAVLVSYSDPDDLYKTKVVYVEDRNGIQRYGYRETQVVAFGCTSVSQAYRVGKWLLYTEQNETETVTFSVGSEGLAIRPGEIIKIADPLRAGKRMGGRLLGASSAGSVTTFTLDASVTLVAGITYTISVLSPVDATQSEYAVLNGAGTTSTIQTALVATLPPTNSIWILAASNLQPQLFKVLTIAEKAKNEYEITATAYNASKYAAVEQNKPITKPPITQLPNLFTPPNPPSTLIIAESLYNAGSAGVQVRVDINFAASSSPNIDFYQVEVRDSTDVGNYTILGTTKDLGYTWLNVNSGIYDFRVQAVNTLGYKSDYATVRQQIFGKNKPPSDVTNLVAAANGQQISLKWDASPDLDVQTGGFFRIKFTSKTSGYTWADGFDVITVGGASNSANVPAYSGTYLIKALTSSGYESTNYTAVDSSFAATVVKNIVLTITDSPTFTGNKNNTVVNNGVLQLAGTDYVDASVDPTNETWDGTSSTEQIDLYSSLFDGTAGNIDDPGDGVNLGYNVDDEISTYAFVSSGTYDLSQTIDLGGVYLSNISASLSAKAVNLFSYFDSTSTDYIDDTTEQVDGTDASGVTTQLLIASSKDNITYTAFQNFTVGSYLGRYFKFRIALASSQLNYNIYVDTFSVTVDMPDRTETGSFASSVSAASVITYSAGFKNSPVVGITIVNGAAGDYFTLSNQTSTGFQISVFNSSGTQVSRTLNWIAKGYGKVSS